VHGTPNIDGVPRVLREIVVGCLARDPAARPRVEAVAAAGLRLVGEIAELSEFFDEDTLVPPGAAEPTLQTLIPPIPLVPPMRHDEPEEPEEPGTTGARAGRTAVDRLLPLRPGRPRVIGLLVALALAAVGLGSWFAADALGHPAAAVNAGHTGSAGGTGTHAAASASTSPKPAVAGKRSATAFAGGTVVTGPGCAASTSAVFSVTPGGSLETGIGGGYQGCGAAADAFRKSGQTTAGATAAAWTFTFRRAVTCTLQVYIANAAPSSGEAVYEITAAGATHRFVLGQSGHKGGFVGAGDLTGVAAPDGVIRLVLTDAGATAGDRNHVTASAARAACTLG
jgi:hypothetical protein